MKIGFIGLGKMGLNMVTRLVQGGHQVVAYARTAATVDQAVSLGAVGAHSLKEVVSQLPTPRIVWVMVPAGETTDKVIEDLSTLLSASDIIIDGGNSNFHDTKARAARLAKKNIRFVDSGTSGGVWGLKVGYCFNGWWRQTVDYDN